MESMDGRLPCATTTRALRLRRRHVHVRRRLQGRQQLRRLRQHRVQDLQLAQDHALHRTRVRSCISRECRAIVVNRPYLGLG